VCLRMPTSTKLRSSAESRYYFAARFVFDNDPPRFLEVHPVEILSRPQTTSPSQAIQAAVNSVLQVFETLKNAALKSKEGWVYLGLMTPHADWAIGCPKNVTSTSLPLKAGDRLTLANDASMRGDAQPLMHAGAPIVGTLHKGEVVTVIITSESVSENALVLLLETTRALGFDTSRHIKTLD
jgi:hypothetical protein